MQTEIKCEYGHYVVYVESKYFALLNAEKVKEEKK